jgi:hypothetical protein
LCISHTDIVGTEGFETDDISILIAELPLELSQIPTPPATNTAAATTILRIVILAVLDKFVA